MQVYSNDVRQCFDFLMSDKVNCDDCYCGAYGRNDTNGGRISIYLNFGQVSNCFSSHSLLSIYQTRKCRKYSELFIICLII